MTARWYIVQAYSNFEKHVQRSIEREAAEKGLDHLFEEILVPTENIVEVRKGRKVESAVSYTHLTLPTILLV